MILIVDDEGSVRRVLRTVLERASLRVVEAASGEEALAVFGERPEIELVLTDLRMPGIDGNELARRLLGIRPRLEILFVSAYLGDIDESFARFDRISKPFRNAELLKKVNGLVGVRSLTT